MIYFDNAATSFPKPLSVQKAVDYALTRYAANPGRSGHAMAQATGEQIYAVREKAAKLFGAQEVEQVVFTQNCTYALNLAIKGLLRHGDHVVISDLEHNSVLRPVHALATNGIIGYSVAETFPGDDERTVLSFAQAIRPQTKAIICTNASNVFGFLLPIEKLGGLAKQYGLYFMVDAAQTAGVEKIDIEKMQIDFLCMPGHKGLYGPTGTGMLITRCGSRLLPLVEGGTGSVSMEYAQPDFLPDRLESGTLGTMGIIGLGAGIDYLNMRGIGRIAMQELQLLIWLYDGLARIPAVRFYSERPKKGYQVAVLSFNLEGLTSEETASRLNEAGFAVRGGLQCAPLAHKKMHTDQSGTVRASLGAFNTFEQVDAFVAAVRRIAAGDQKSNRTKKD